MERKPNGRIDRMDDEPIKPAESFITPRSVVHGIGWGTLIALAGLVIKVTDDLPSQKEIERYRAEITASITEKLNVIRRDISILGEKQRNIDENGTAELKVMRAELRGNGEFLRREVSHLEKAHERLRTRIEKLEEKF